MGELNLTKNERRALAVEDERQRMRNAVDLQAGLLRSWIRKNIRCGSKRCPGKCGKTISRTAMSCLACSKDLDRTETALSVA